MQSQRGERLRRLEESQNLYLRRVVTLLNMDIVQLRKIEIRQLKKEQIRLLRVMLKTDKVALETVWLADQLMQLVKDEPTQAKH